MQEFQKFSNIYSQRSDIRKHWDGILKLIGLLNDFVARLVVHLHAMQKLLFVFCMSGSINYHR